VPLDTEALAGFLGGFVAGDGCFCITSNGRRFKFEVGLGAIDRGLCDLLQSFLGIGNVYESPRRTARNDDEVVFAVQSLAELVDVVVPFMDAHLPPSYKRTQYLAWKERLLEYWEHRAKRVRPCTVDGCDEPRRAHGLCRLHLYERHHV
jgi:hypothetical protein